MDKQIVNYYMLCNVGSRGNAHALNSILNTPKTTFTKKEVELYWRLRDGVYVVREDIIGGQSRQREPALIF
jgi:hypothetical protein